MITCKLIVMPTDLSENSLFAIPYAVSMAQLFGAQLHIVTVHQPFVPMGDIGGGVPPIMPQNEHETYLREALNELVRKHLPRDVDVTASVLVGRPVDEIIKYARHNNADLIVMAAHGHGGLARAFMGSTAEMVVRKATCPVMTLKQPRPAPVPQKTRARSSDVLIV